jgi:type IV pilus assembly protein PilV
MKTILLRYRRVDMAGVGLIEVLISVMVLGVGILGIAAMQATALRNSQGSLQRSQAAIQAYTIFDAMRANLPAATAGSYNQKICTAPGASNLVSNDLANWIKGVQAALGSSACGTINCSVTACSASISWDESRAKDGSANQTFTIQTRL